MESAKVARGLLATREKRLSIVLPPEVHQELKTMAAEQSASIKDLILEAYTHYLVPKYKRKI